MNNAFIGHLIFSKQAKLLKQHNIKYMDVVYVYTLIQPFGESKVYSSYPDLIENAVCCAFILK